MHRYQHFFDRETREKTRTGGSGVENSSSDGFIQITPLLREWDYGEYEGLTLTDIRERLGHDGWNIWRDGCPGGEYVLPFLFFLFLFIKRETKQVHRSPQQVTERIDALIAEIKQRILTTATAWPGGSIVTHTTGEASDIVCIGDGHVLSAMALRWVRQPLGNGMRLLIEPASVAVLG